MHRFSQVIQKLCCVFAVFAFLSVALAHETLPIRSGEERNQIIRVCLTRLGGRDRLDLTFTAPYQLAIKNGTTMFFRAGSQVTFQIENDLIYLYYQEMGQLLGKEVILERTNETSDLRSGFRLTNFPALYMGDLNLDIVEGKLRSVLSIHLEDYLLGVVPYEMGETFPLEALKAQAVAARTYALQRQGQYADYDIVDNTNDQVYRGYIPGYERSEQAVEETRGICGFYKGRLAQCYYAASNGGQTELVQSVWSSRKAYEYYAFGEDPYDIANPESVVRSFKLLKHYTEEKKAPFALREIIAERLAEELKDQGHGVSPDNVRIDEIMAVSVDTPSEKGSKHMTNLHMELAISLRTEPEFTIRDVDISPEEVYLFEETIPTPNKQATTISVPEATYTPFTPHKENITIDISIFPDAEEAFDLNVSPNYQNEIWSIVEQEKEFIIEVRRYGHGVGMSQRGAQWMAAEYGKSYQDILAFYYPGMELILYPEQPRQFADAEDALAANAGPAPTPTPRPTLMPTTRLPKDGEWFATVTEIADDSSLNLRASPSMNSDILMRLYKNQLLLVLERVEEEGWVHVCTDTAEGYVMEKYLTMQE